MKLLQATPVCGARTDNISLLLGFHLEQDTKHLPLVSRAFSGSSEYLTWAVLLTWLLYFRERSQGKKGAGSEGLAPLLPSAPLERLLLPVRRPERAPTPGQRLPAGSARTAQLN